MSKEITIYQSESIEKKNEETAKNLSENEGKSDNLAKLIAEIIVEIIIKKHRNGRNRIHQDK
ncbi:MAG: hypothetical protein JWQ84_932 [Mucilaginibacter sp.]|nr:hypothetical protein [Mucilaginibacter sp.]